MKIAIVHDYLNQRGGAERVVASFLRMFPDAPIFTSFYTPDQTYPEFRQAKVVQSFMKLLPSIKRLYRSYFPIYPIAFKTLDFNEYDVILSSSSGWAHGIKISKESVHICYCHTPARWLWDSKRYMERDDYGLLVRILLLGFLPLLRLHDVRVAKKPDLYIANSRVVQKRIETFYGCSSIVINPPIEVERFPWDVPAGDFYLVVSRLSGYKRIDLVIEAFNELKLPLHIVGDGPLRKALQAMAGPTVHFLGPLIDSELVGEFSHCRAVIFPGEEDFGIVPLEANACGKPVIAYGAGGALETVIDGVTGIFFHEPSAASIIAAIRQEQVTTFDSRELRLHAESYSCEVFARKIKEAVSLACEKRFGYQFGAVQAGNTHNMSNTGHDESDLPALPLGSLDIVDRQVGPGRAGVPNYQGVR